MRDRASRGGTAGFTLVEVSVVIVCIGVLSALAMVGYIRHRRTARMAEATNLVSMIKTEQEAHKNESGLYAVVSNSVDAYYPSANPGKFATAWGGPCGNCVNAQAWQSLGVKPGAPVVYGYATVAGVGEDVATAPGNLSSMMRTTTQSASARSDDDDSAGGNACQQIAPTAPYYVIQAKGDTDGDGVACTVLALSCSNSLVLTNVGE